MMVHKYAAILLVGLMLVGGVSAASWYVDNTASGSNSGTSWSNAWKSFSSISWSSVQPGDTIYISGGSSGKTYTQGLSVGKNGAQGAPITITGGKDSGHNGLVTFTGNGITIEARRYITISKMKFGTDSRIRISGSGGMVYDAGSASKFIVVEDNEFYVTIQGGVFVQTSDNVIVRNSVMTTPTYDSSQTDGIYSQRNKNNIYEYNSIIIYNQNTKGHDDAIQMYQDDSTIVRGNYLAQVNYKTSNAQGLYATTMYGTTVYYNNVINLGNTESNALSFKRNSGGGGTGTIVMIGNTVYAKRPDHALWVDDTPNPVVKNNIVYTLSGAGLSLSGSGAEVSNNFIGDPKFVSISNNDFRLQSGSPAINGGVNLGSPYNTDKDGNSRGSSWDIGAYEFGGAPPVCTDSDGDGYGQGCSLGSDCNDNNPNINPGVQEICGNNIDEDCNGFDVQCTGFNPDTNGDGCVSLNEIVAYVEKWKNGQVAIQEVVAGVEQWKLGCS